jgi:hypothetical protein
LPTSVPWQVTTSAPYWRPAPVISMAPPIENVSGPDDPLLAGVTQLSQSSACHLPRTVGSTTQAQVSVPWV